MLRIGFDARLIHYRQGGIGQYSLNLLRELAQLQAEENFRLVVYQSRKEKQPLEKWLDLPGVKAEGHKLWTPPHNRFEQKALPGELALNGPDVFHSPDFIPPFRRQTLYLNSPASQKKRLHKISSVITIHDLAFIHYPYLLTRESSRYYKQVQRAVYSADRVIAVSESTARDIVKQLGLGREKIKVIYEAANPLFKPQRPFEMAQLEAGPAKRVALQLRKEGLNPAEGFLLFVSTIEPRKNLPVLLKAFRRMLNEVSWSRPRPRLVLAGREGWLFDEIYQLVEELGLQNEVIWTGEVETQELLWLYNQATCLALPSLYEGFGLPALEALACGTPVLVADTSSLPEVVGEAGLKLAPKDVEAWAAALKNCWFNRLDLKTQFREKGPSRAALFSWEKAARETLGVYREAL